jgi:hypothetical protein
MVKPSNKPPVGISLGEHTMIAAWPFHQIENATWIVDLPTIGTVELEAQPGQW